MVCLLSDHIVVYACVDPNTQKLEKVGYLLILGQNTTEQNTTPIHVLFLLLSVKKKQVAELIYSKGNLSSLFLVGHKKRDLR